MSKSSRSMVTATVAVALLAFASLAQADLVTEYTFEEGSGTVATNSGTGANGTIFGGATWAPGRDGGLALCLDGVDDSVQLDDGTFTGNTTATTIAAWVFGGVDNPESTTWFWGSNVTTGGSAGRQMQVHLPWNNGITYWRAPGTQIQYNSTPAMGSWNHWAFTKDSGTGDIGIWLNGTQVASNTTATGTFNVVRSWLGSQSGSDRFYHGCIDDFQVHDTVLTAAEIQALAVPEPGSLALLGIGVLGLVTRRRRK